jgi:hypothetical protein
MASAREGLSFCRINPDGIGRRLAEPQHATEAGRIWRIGKGSRRRSCAGPKRPSLSPLRLVNAWVAGHPLRRGAGSGFIELERAKHPSS